MKGRTHERTLNNSTVLLRDKQKESESVLVLSSPPRLKERTIDHVITPGLSDSELFYRYLLKQAQLVSGNV